MSRCLQSRNLTQSHLSALTEKIRYENSEILMTDKHEQKETHYLQTACMKLKACLVLKTVK